jgi:hypothetical protein
MPFGKGSSIKLNGTYLRKCTRLSSFRRMLEECCMDAPFTDQRMASRDIAPSRFLDPGMHRWYLSALE